MRSFVLGMLMVCAAYSVCAAQEGDAGIQGKITALEKLWNQAYKSGDTKALDTILDDSIVLINDDGSIQSKKEFLASVKASNAQEQQVAPEMLKVNVHGNVAIASGVLRVKAGDSVRQGEIIGQVGFSGDAIFPHVHYSLLAGPDIYRSESLPAYFTQFRRLLGNKSVRVEQGTIDSGDILESTAKYVAKP